MGLWARCTAPYSLLRTLLYEKLSGLTLHGRVLDVGGGTRKSSYLSLLRVEGALESLNIDPERAPTFVTRSGTSSTRASADVAAGRGRAYS